MRLDAADIEAIALRVSELIREHDPEATTRYVDARQLARALGVERDWVYAHATQLGAIRLGGPTGRLRFDLQHAKRSLTAPTTKRPARRPSRPARRSRARVDLLPYES